MAIPMPIVQDIRRLDRQGMSRAQIARRLHVDRGTVAKYADMEDCSPKPKADRRYGSKIDPYAHLVDGWLEADRLLPRKQRHTIRRVHDRLLAETDYDGEYSTTMRYVHRWREANRGVPDREGYVRLEWAAGSMQVDFGVARARIAGEMADVHCLVVSLPYSNMRLCVALPGENAECLCHGLMLVFEHIGGVPPVIVMDNATGAGRRNAKGRGRVDRGVLRVRGALPARGPVLQPVFGQREGQRGERGRVFAAQSHGAAHARGIVWAVEPSPAGAVRRARQGLVLPEVAGRARGRGVRRGEGRVDAVAVHGRVSNCLCMGSSD